MKYALFACKYCKCAEYFLVERSQDLGKTCYSIGSSVESSSVFVLVLSKPSKIWATDIYKFNTFRHLRKAKCIFLQLTFHVFILRLRVSKVFSAVIFPWFVLPLKLRMYFKLHFSCHNFHRSEIPCPRYKSDQSNIFCWYDMDIPLIEDNRKNSDAFAEHIGSKLITYIWK